MNIVFWLIIIVAGLAFLYTLTDFFETIGSAILGFIDEIKDGINALKRR